MKRMSVVAVDENITHCMDENDDNDRTLLFVSNIIEANVL